MPNLSRRLLPLLFFALSTTALAGGIELRAPTAISDLLQPYLPEEAGSQRKLQALLSEILATEGYFSPQFEFTEDSGDLRLSIDPGPRTSIGELEIIIDGPLPPESRAALLAGWGLAVGQPFRQEDWNSAKQQVLAELLAVDFAAATLVDSTAEIDSAAHRAKLSVHYASGPRYRFGELRIAGLQRYDPDLIARYNRAVRRGAPYREESLNALRSSLQATPYFSSVEAGLDLASATGSGDTVDVPVFLRLRERPAHSIAFGVGASSNTGARVSFNYHTPDVFNQAWEMDSGLRLEQKKQTIYTDFFLPPDDRLRRHSVGVMAEGTDIQGLRTERYAFGAQTVQQRGSAEQRLALNWEDEKRYADGVQTSTARALAPNAMWTLRQVDSGLDPRRGFVLQLQVGGGAKAAWSDQNFLRLHARYQHFIPLGRVDTLALRGEVGYTQAASRQGIPQNYLFRTGGTGSVRGYAYQSLGLREGGAVVGGRYLGVLSAEATHWLDDTWGIAAFVDAGDAVDSWQDVRLAVGYGLGARWRSPAGPIGADLAYGQRTGKVQLHFSLAIPF
ncbi:MAG: surface antigen [Proteobacteria bacterium]|nr:surface antigen [Pseudomonadota bacterium]